jgi:oxygen-independent coproporphyrinogen-3 oxidase
MTLVVDGHPFHYEMENLCRIFVPSGRIRVVSEPCGDSTEAYTGLKKRPDGTELTVRLAMEGAEREKTELLPPGTGRKETERRMAVLLWEMFSGLLDYRPRWGILTGVRPVKLLGSLVSEKGEKEAVRFFRDALLVSPEKAGLALATLRNQKKILSLFRPDSFSLYIAIPFCPTRCSYCSFVSSSVEKTFRLIPRYVELLCGEIRRTAEVASGLHLRPQSVYVGGGTPTVLSEEQLAAVLAAVRENFDLSSCREFTVEAGRPDTVTAGKLDVMKAAGVTRISINPQTLNDSVLRAIGRKHTAAQTLSAFALARQHGFGNINMDLIAGLPEDGPESFRKTVEGVLHLSPESVTVHTLALKRAARLAQEPGRRTFVGARTAETMLESARTLLLQSGYLPYYLYRQSRMVGNLENTGWAKPGFESLYNVMIMEECQTILACGAGAVTKLRDPFSDRIERVFNFKYPYEYISRYEEMLNRKDQVNRFYAGIKDKICNVPEQPG